MIVTKV